MQLKTRGTEEGLLYQTFEESIRHNTDHRKGETITTVKRAEFSILTDRRAASAGS